MTHASSRKGVRIARVVEVNNCRHPYAITTSEGTSGTVTFSLWPKVWVETRWPRAGERVVIDDLRKNDHGWRAYKARFLRLEDEESKQLKF